MQIPFFTNKYQDQIYGRIIREKLDDLIKRGIFILGNEVREFEEKVKTFHKC